MANVKKFTRQAVGNLLAHFERRQKLNAETGEMEYAKFGNRDIDTRWSELNYRTWPPLSQDDYKIRGVRTDPQLAAIWQASGDPDESSLDRWRRIYHNTPHAKRKDLACFCSWSISLPDPIPLDKADVFFNLCTRYCISKYGAENIVGAWVHWDEIGRPHIHVAFVPVAETTTTGEDGSTTTSRRICAKDVLHRGHLSSWHGGLTALVQKEMNIQEPGILNGRTEQEGGNRSIKALKARQKAYERSRGKEVDQYRNKALNALRKAVENAKRPRLDNLCMDAERRKEAQLQEPRKRSLSEILQGR